MADSSDAQRIADLEAELVALRAMYEQKIEDQKAEIERLQRQQGEKQHTAVNPQSSKDEQVQPVTQDREPFLEVERGKANEPAEQRNSQERGNRYKKQGFLCTETVEVGDIDGDRAVFSIEPLPGAGLGAKDTIERYKKTGGAADGAGNDYEHKMLTLVFLRMLAAGYRFQLASNMESAGKFDDIVMRYRKLTDTNWNSIFVQLKHKQNKNKFISKPELLGLSGDFSLIGYCHSYETMKKSKELHSFGNFNESKIIIFTNASIADGLVCELVADTLLDTGGKAVSFKEGGEVFQELCEWVDIKESLTELQSQVVGLSNEVVKKNISVAIEKLNFICKTVTSFKCELLKTPTLVKLEALLTKLEHVKDKDTYSLFLTKLQVYTNQVHESKLNAKIKEEAGKVWKCSVDLEAGAMLGILQAKVKSWWQKDNFYLAQDSQLWLDIIKLQTETLSKSTINRLTEFEVKFEETSLQILDGRINKMSSASGILNLCVDSRTSASSLRVHQALDLFCQNKIVLHVNVKALLEREEDVLSAWASRWCRLLVVECDQELDQSQAKRIGAKILEVIGNKNQKKLVVLIAPETHFLHQEMKGKTSELHIKDSIQWGDLKQETQEIILQTKVNVQGAAITLSDFEKKEKESDMRDVKKMHQFRDCLADHFNLEIFSQLLNGDINCGKTLENLDKIFVPRRLKKSNDMNAFLVNSVGDFGEKVVLLVAEPGMGKSTLMAHIANCAKEEDPTAWIVLVKLNDCTAYLDSVDKEKLDAEGAWKFLEWYALNRGNDLEEFLFRSLEHKLIVFVDGVDEVNPHYNKQTFTLLSLLKDFKFNRLWVSSRPTFESKLENILGVGSINITEFSVSDQTEYFNKTWRKEDDSISNEKCNKKTDNLLKVFGNSFGKYASILGVPLITSMIAEVYNSSIDKFVRIGRLNKISLVETYLERRFQILCDEKMKMENRHLSASKDNEKVMREHIHSNHCLAALRVIFSPEEIKTLKFKGKEDFDKDLTSYLEEVTRGQEKTGIIDNIINDVPHFTHRLFAEYFAAMWLQSNFKTMPDFTNKIIFHPAYKTVGEIFNQILADMHPLHEAVLCKDFNDLKYVLETQSDVNELDDGGRTALHHAVLLSGTEQHPDYLNITKILIQEYNALVDIADSIAGWTPLQYAEQARAWDALEFVFKNGGKNTEEWPRPDPAVMLDAARDASVFVVRYLVEERGGMLDCRGTEGETMIHRAAEGGNYEILEYLVSKGLSLHIKDKEENTALHYTTHNDHVSAVHLLLKQGLYMEACNSRGLTAFQEAAQRGAYNVMAVLLELKASFHVDSSAKSVQVNASLLCAAFSGSFESIKNLVKMGASVDHQDNKGHMAAWVAMHRKHYQVMDWLLLCVSLDGETPLHGACAKGDLEIVNLILSRGDNIDAKGWKGRTPLMAAAWNNNLAVMELLLAKGANVECRDENGFKLLHKVSLIRNKKAVELLLLHGAQAKSANSYGETLLHTAIMVNNLDVVNLLVCDYNHQPSGKLTIFGRAGVTSLVAAAVKGDVDGVINMLDNFNIKREGMSIVDFINVKDTAGWTVLHYLACIGQSDIIPYIINQGGDQEIRNNRNSTPLHLAASFKRPGTVRVLLTALNEADRAAAVNAPGFNGDSVLMCGAWKGCMECVRLLVEAGGKLTQVNNSGWTSLMLAAFNNHAHVVSFLLLAFGSKSEEGLTLKGFINMKDRNGKNSLDCAGFECSEVIKSFLGQI